MTNVFYPDRKGLNRDALQSNLIDGTRNISETSFLLGATSAQHLKRQLAKLSSVILPETGRKVHRSDLFFNTEFESFHDDTINDSEHLDSGFSENVSETWHARLHASIRTLPQYINRWLRDDSFQSVLKCGVAYLLASLGVYYSPFSLLLGNTDSKHVAATASVYFHPARSKGSMHQLFLFVLMSLMFTFFLSISSRLISSHFFNVGQNEVSYAIDLVASSVGLGTIAFMKQKVNRETFNTACSLASISLVTCIVKEGSLNSSIIPMQRIVSSSQVALVGSLISVATCYVLWPKSAVKLLRCSLNDSFNVMSSLVSVVTHRFITGDKISTKDLEVFSLLRKHANDLTIHLEEAKYELFLVGNEAEYDVYCEIVDATNSLMEHLHALKSSCEMRWQLFVDSTVLENEDQHSVASLASIHEPILPLSHSVENLGSPSLYNGRLQNNEMDDSAVYSVQLFDLFVYYLAPSIKSLAFTVKEVLSVVPFEKKLLTDTEQSLFVKSTNYQISLKKAIELYEEKQVNSFEKLYSQKIFKSSDFQSRTDQEEVTACCGNFSSLLALYGKQLIHFLQLTEKFEVVASTSPRSWSWIHSWWRKGRSISHAKSHMGDAQFIDALRELKSQLKVVEPNENTISSTSWRDWLDMYRLRLWKAFSLLKRTDVQFGLRVGVGSFCISVFAFLPHTQKAFVEYRLEWTLAIFCIMMSKSLGGTSMTAKWRFTGTFMGAFLAYLAWQISDANAVVLASVGFFLSLPCFYIIIYWKRNNAYGRFILLAYNLTALYSYSMLQNDSEDKNEGGDLPIVDQIAVHRFIAVSIGIVWALMFSNFFLPNPARARLKSGLTILWLRMGVIWNSNPMDFQESESGKTLTGLKDYKGTRDLLLECQTLLQQAPVELRLKGKFPKKIYESLLRGTSAILDAFLNLQLMVEVDKDLHPMEEIVLKCVSSEREELEHRIFLIFYMVASAMALGFPLPTKPASTEHAKDRMLLKLSDFRSKRSFERVSLKNEDYVLLYSYILVTSTITKELDKIIVNIKELLGDISEDIFVLV